MKKYPMTPGRITELIMSGDAYVFERAAIDGEIRRDVIHKFLLDGFLYDIGQAVDPMMSDELKVDEFMDMADRVPPEDLMLSVDDYLHAMTDERITDEFVYVVNNII